jgi:hypothetical protein
MIILPGLVSTKKENIPAFLDELLRLRIDRIALFPTCLNKRERERLYEDLELIPSLRLPHVHVRSDSDEGEIGYLIERFGTEAFNIHPRASAHSYGSVPLRYARNFFVENVDVPPEEEELLGLGGLCPDFSHLENARLFGRAAYVARMDSLFARYAVGCCHINTIRIGDPNDWSGGWDHHDFKRLSEFDYMAKYGTRLPTSWASLELENPLSEQLKAADYIIRLVSNRMPRATSG